MSSAEICDYNHIEKRMSGLGGLFCGGQHDVAEEQMMTVSLTSPPAGPGHASLGNLIKFTVF